MLVRNRPTPEGEALGKELARFADAADVEQRKQFPDMSERCVSCAFRLGTVPNGCPETVMDALKCVIEGNMFMCHQSPKDAEGCVTEPCMGWFLLASQVTAYGKVQWDYSLNEYTPEERAAVNGRADT